MKSNANTLDNSINSQVYIPYRFEHLQVELGDYGYNPATTTPDVSNCGSISSTGVNQYQRKVCDALATTSGQYLSPHWTATPGTPVPAADTPIFAECSSDAHLKTTPGSESYLRSVDDPISYDPAITAVIMPTENPHGRGMSQNGANRWAYGNSGRAGDKTPYSVQWKNPYQILTHYYTGVEVRNSGDSVIIPPKRWNLLYHDLPSSLQLGSGQPITLTLQNTGITTWNNYQYSVFFTWCTEASLGSSCPNYSSNAYWIENLAIGSNDPEASLVDLGETVQYVEGMYLSATETQTENILVLDVCNASMIGLRRRAGESVEEWGKRVAEQRKRKPEATQNEMVCFGNQSPGWNYYYKTITLHE